MEFFKNEIRKKSKNGDVPETLNNKAPVGTAGPFQDVILTQHNKIVSQNCDEPKTSNNRASIVSGGPFQDDLDLTQCSGINSLNSDELETSNNGDEPKTSNKRPSIVSAVQFQDETEYESSSTGTFDGE